MVENEIGKCMVDLAVQIHRQTGPGLLETVYETILAHQLRQRGFQLERQIAIAIEYRGLRFDEGFRADMIVENKVIVELKCVEKLNNAYKKQLKIRIVDNGDNNCGSKVSSLLPTMSQVVFVYKDRKHIGSASFETSQHCHYIIVTMVGKQGAIDN